MSLVRFREGEIPPLTEEEKAELKAASERPDSEIDVSDIPPLGDDFWKHAVRNPFYKPLKTSTTLRIDSDVLAWFKSQGKVYQTKINAVLREVMMRSMKQ